MLQKQVLSKHGLVLLGVDNAIKDILLEAKITTAATDIKWIYDQVKELKHPFPKIQKIVSKWIDEVYSKKVDGSSSHKKVSDITALSNAASMYLDGKEEHNKETMSRAKEIFDSRVKTILSRFGESVPSK